MRVETSGLIVSPVAEDVSKIGFQPLRWGLRLRAEVLSRASITNHPLSGTYGEEGPKSVAGCDIKEYRRETCCS